MSPRRTWRGVPAVAISLGLAACGTTVQGVGPVAGDGLGGSERPVSTSRTSTSSQPSPTTWDRAGQPPTSRGGPDNGSPASPAHGSDVITLPTVPGVTDQAVYVGLLYTTNGDQLNAAFGAGGLTSGAERPEQQAIVDDINAHGGVAGRRLVPVWHALDATSTASGSAKSAAACADLTQDHHVFAATFTLDDGFAACLSRAGVLQLLSTSGVRSGSAAFFRSHPRFVDLTGINQDRTMRELVASLSRRDWFHPWDTTLGRAGAAPVKVGVVTSDDPNLREPVDHVLLPALARAGHRPDPADVFRIAPSDDPSALVAAIQAAELRMRTDGVTHVILTDTGGGLTVYFTKFAESQGYYPRYAETTAAGVQVLVDQGLISKKSMSGMRGFGWSPMSDLPLEQAKKHLTSAASHCLKVLAAKGFAFTSANPMVTAFGFCDALYGLQRALDLAARPLTPVSALQSVEGFAGSFTPALTPAALLSAAQHDGVALGFDMQWDDACGCESYFDAGHVVPS